MLMKRITGSGISWELSGDFKSIWNMAVRLKQIEDILGDDYALDRLKELVEADREGKVILRKTKEGSKVYIILLGRIFPFDVISATWNSKNAVYEAEHGKYLRYMFNDADIGISVFLTREEAEAALERMEGEEK